MGKTCYKLEFQFAQVSRTQMWSMLSTAEGLSMWIGAKVNIDQGKASFLWSGGAISHASVVIDAIEKKVVFRWLTELGGFVLKQSRSDLTKDLTLVILDECDESDLESNQHIWEHQVAKLQYQLGICN